MLEKLPNKLLLNSDFLLKNEFSSGISGEPECLDETIHFICCITMSLVVISSPLNSFLKWRKECAISVDCRARLVCQQD